VSAACPPSSVSASSAEAGGSLLQGPQFTDGINLQNRQIGIVANAHLFSMHPDEPLRKPVFHVNN
jgi:hypothetical protein